MTLHARPLTSAAFAVMFHFVSNISCYYSEITVTALVFIDNFMWQNPSPCWRLGQGEGHYFVFHLELGSLVLISCLACLLGDDLHFSCIVFILIMFQLRLQHIIINNKHLLNSYGLWIRLQARY